MNEEKRCHSQVEKGEFRHRLPILIVSSRWSLPWTRTRSRRHQRHLLVVKITATRPSSPGSSMAVSSTSRATSIPPTPRLFCTALASSSPARSFLSGSRVETEEPDTKRARTSASVVEEGQTEPGSSVDNATESGKPQEFHLVKLARNGMVYISVPRRASADLVTFFANTIHAFHTRSRPAPRWCHRIFPVQTTCVWTKEDVRSSVVVLVKEFLERHTAVSADSPLKYAVAVNRRGLEEKEKPAGDSGAAALGKLECIHTVAEAIQSLTPHVSVDLTNPQMVVIVEVLPLVRVESCVCAVSVLPREVVLTKPKLVIQGLAPPKQQKQKK